MQRHHPTRPHPVPPQRPPVRPASLQGRLPSLPSRKHLVGAWFVSSALIAWGLVGFPIMPARSFPGLAAPGTQPALSPAATDDAILKVNRLARPPITGRHDPEPAPKKERSVGKDGAKIPVGCDGAFSRLVVHGNFSARCVT